MDTISIQKYYFFLDITYIVSTIENIEYYSSDIRVIQNIPTLYSLSYKNIQIQNVKCY